jgi:glycosyltransferase involved in cell wall biosynthesis
VPGRANSEPRPIRILRLIARLNIGGPAIHTMLLTERLAPPDFESVLVTGRLELGEGDMSDWLSGKLVRHLVIPSLRQKLGLHDLAAWWSVFRLMRRERPDIVHTHTAKAGALGRSAAVMRNGLLRAGAWLRGRPAQRCRIVHTFHGHVLEGYFSRWASRVFVMIERWLASRSDALIAVSRAVRDELLALGIGRPEQWRVIPLGLDLSALAQLCPSDAETPLRVGMVGRLVPIKNPSLFLAALSRAASKQPGTRLAGIIAGDGPLRPALEAQARELGLGGRVQFTGWQRDLPSLYEGLEAVCLTSWNEGTPVALIEAMAAGHPVVATDVGGVGDLLEGKERSRGPIPTGTYRVTERGILVRPGDAEGLAGALVLLAEDPGLRQGLGRAGRAYVTQRFSIERLVRDLTRLYEQLMEEGG